jgi:hypothetical protein
VANVIAAQIFWALSWLPGFALVRRAWPRGLHADLMGAVAYGYVASFALMAPVAVACYWLRLPVAVLTAWWAVGVGATLVWLTRTARWREIGRMLRAEVGLAAALLVAHLVMQARVGGWLDGDATFHLGRIRHLLDHGFDNRDIYLRAEHFTPIYHTNLVHAWFAVATQITQGDPLDVWWASLAWAKLLITAGHYALAYALLRRQEPAWLYALVIATVQAGVTYAVYPNALAVGWLLPVVLALAVASHDDDSHAESVAVAVTAFVVGLVHPLYALFAMLIAAPYAGARALDMALGRARNPAHAPRARSLALVAVALLAGAPPGMVSRFVKHAPAEPASARGAFDVEFESPSTARPAVTRPAPATATKPKAPLTPALAAGGGPLEKKLERRADGRLWLPPAKMGGTAFVLFGLLALALVSLAPSSVRARARAVAAAAAPCALILFWPWLCTLAARPQLTAAIPRLVPILSSALFLALVCAGMFALQRLPRPRLVWPAATLASVALATGLLGFSPRSSGEHLRDVLASRQARHAMLDLHRARRAVLRAHVPEGTTVLASLREARYVVMLHDVFVVAADRGHAPSPGIRERRAAVERMTAKGTPWEEREALLRRHGIRHVVFLDKWRHRYLWAVEHGHERGAGGGLHVVELAL